MARTTQGRTFKRRNRWWVDYSVNGERIRESLGKEITTKSEAERELKNRVAPFTAADTVAKTRAMVHRLHDAEGAAAAATDIPLDDVWELFATGSSRADSTMTRYRSYWDHFLEWIHVNRPEVTRLSQISQQVALSYADGLASRKLSGRTFNAYRQGLSLITSKAMLKSGLGSINPWKAVELKPLDTVSRRELTKEEAAAVLAYLDQSSVKIPSRTVQGGWKTLASAEEWRVVFRLGMFAGLRLADAVTLEWDNVNMTKREISTIPQKTRRKLRRVTIPMHPDLYAVLCQAQAWQDDSSRICPSLADRYQRNPTGVDKDAVDILAACGLVVSQKVKGRATPAVVYGFHSLRHSFVSWCADAGVPMAVVQSFVGHGSPAMTRHYTHIGEDVARRAVNSIPSPGEALQPTMTEAERKAAIQDRLMGDDVPEELRRDLLALLNG